MFSTGFNTRDGTRNSHIYGNDFKKDDWLIIEADMPFQSVSDIESSNRPLFFGGVSKSQSCYTPYDTITSNGLGVLASAQGPRVQTAGFDVSIRSKYNVISHAQS